MLPNNSFSFERFVDIYNQTPRHWASFSRHYPVDAQTFRSLADNPFIRYAAKLKHIPDEDIETVVCKAVLLMNASLGQAVTSMFLQVNFVETVIAMMSLASKNIGQFDDSYRRSDLQIMILSEILLHLGPTCSPKPREFLFEILNRLPLPYFKHCVLIEQVGQALDVSPPTRH